MCTAIHVYVYLKREWPLYISHPCKTLMVPVILPADNLYVCTSHMSYFICMRVMQCYIFPFKPFIC